MTVITEQPKSSMGSMMKRLEDDETPCDATRHRDIHQSRLRRLVISSTILLITALTVLFLEFNETESGVIGEGEGLLRRAIGTNNTGNSSGFVKNKLYLIVVIVGLFIVLVAAIALSFWCCRGAFHNPLCCPCYLCACCGGLVCLECISCGLCAEGFENLNV
ncbi:hypothetical protein K439DRAFT_1664956 [Ramaria rubella]|nr:hypothetical protein K439DRAFT_1664956 [Ramaria rubella]